MRAKITFLGELSQAELSEISEFLCEDCSTLGSWAKFTRTDSPFNFVVCSNGEHFIRLSGYDTKGTRFYKIKEVKTYINDYGYVAVSGFSTMHQLVAEAFISDFVPYPEKEVNHIDGNKLNNNITNLELVYHKQNMEHFWSADCMEDNRNSWVSKHVGRHWSESQRKKFMSKPHPKHWSDEQRAKMSARHKGKKLSADHIARIKEVNRGSHYSRGLISVTDGFNNKNIKLENLPEWELKGYHRGKTIRNIPKCKKPYTHTAEFLEKQRIRKLSSEVV